MEKKPDTKSGSMTGPMYSDGVNSSQGKPAGPKGGKSVPNPLGYNTGSGK